MVNNGTEPARTDDCIVVLGRVAFPSPLVDVVDSLARRIDALEVEVGNLRRALTDHQLGEDHE